jgi:hypothetical protein
MTNLSFLCGMRALRFHFPPRTLRIPAIRTLTSMLSEKSVQELEADIAAQKSIFNDLRAQGAPLEDAKKQLGDLQRTLQLVKGAGKEKEKKAEGSGGQHQVNSQPKKKERLLLKTAKVKSCLVCYHAADDGLMSDM